MKITQLALLFFFAGASSYAQINGKVIKRLTVKPSITDPRITSADTPHLIQYVKNRNSHKLLVFLPGSNGIAINAAPRFIATALEQGYRVITLSYINNPAISSTCFGNTLANDSDCAEKFRDFRALGVGEFPLIKDQAFDAIVNRLNRLLVYLAAHDKTSNWNAFLSKGNIDWSNIILAGQSQGGGMACYIAKKHVVGGVITFSGGWDFSEKGKIATWYAEPSATPLNRWFGAYHQEEPTADFIKQTYEAMGIPTSQLYALNEAVPINAKAHGQSVSNVIYKSIWIKMLTAN